MKCLPTGIRGIGLESWWPRVSPLEPCHQPREWGDRPRHGCWPHTVFLRWQMDAFKFVSRDSPLVPSTWPQWISSAQPRTPPAAWLFGGSFWPLLAFVYLPDDESALPGVWEAAFIIGDLPARWHSALLDSGTPSPPSSLEHKCCRREARLTGALGRAGRPPTLTRGRPCHFKSPRRFWKDRGRVPPTPHRGVARSAPAATSRDVWRRQRRPFWGPPRWLLRRCPPVWGWDQGWPRRRPAGRHYVAGPLQGQGWHPPFAGSFQPDPLTGAAGPNRRYHRHRSRQSANPRWLPARVPGSQRPGHHSWGPAHPVRYGHRPGPGKSWRTWRGEEWS
jgi:hypothetical protein